MRALRPVLWLVLAALAGCAHAPLSGGEGRVVEAEGWSPLDAKDLLASRERALAEAQRKAVEKAAGVRVSAVTKVAQAVTLDQRIEASVGGTIRSYEVLSERADEGFLKVRIRAIVLLEAPPAPQPPERARLAVLIGEEPLSGAVRLALSGRGFRLTEKAEEADAVVRGGGKAYPQAAGGLSGFRSYRGRASLEYQRRGSPEIVLESREGAGLDPVDEIARDKALESAGRLAAEALALKLTAAAVQAGR